MRGVYVIAPGLYVRFKLLKKIGWGLFGYWEMVAASNDYDDLRSAVDACGGKLLNRTALQTEKGKD